MYMDDHDIALRMANDPTYSPPYAYRSIPSNEVSSYFVAYKRIGYFALELFVF